MVARLRARAGRERRLDSRPRTGPGRASRVGRTAGKPPSLKGRADGLNGHHRRARRRSEPHRSSLRCRPRAAPRGGGRKYCPSPAFTVSPSTTVPDERHFVRERHGAPARPPLLDSERRGEVRGAAPLLGPPNRQSVCWVVRSTSRVADMRSLHPDEPAAAAVPGQHVRVGTRWPAGCPRGGARRLPRSRNAPSG